MKLNSPISLNWILLKTGLITIHKYYKQEEFPIKHQPDYLKKMLKLIWINSMKKTLKSKDLSLYLKINHSLTLKPIGFLKPQEINKFIIKSVKMKEHNNAMDALY